jgi:nickel transport protein
MKNAITSTILATLFIIPTLPAQAHGIWLGQRSKQVVLVYGEGADDLDMVKREPLVDAVAAYDADLNPIKASHRISGLAMVIDTEAKPSVVTAILQNGVWSRMKGGKYERKGLDEMPGAEVSTNNVKYAVSIQGPLSTPLSALAGQTLQIVPVGPIPVKLGARLKYKVLYQGKPVAGARLINDFLNDPDAAEVSTGADGTVVMPVRNQGLNVVRAVYEGPSDNPARYRRVEHTATLSFTLAHKPE